MTDAIRTEDRLEWIGVRHEEVNNDVLFQDVAVLTLPGDVGGMAVAKDARAPVFVDLHP